jgi:hypothetical protein
MMHDVLRPEILLERALDDGGRHRERGIGLTGVRI